MTTIIIIPCYNGGDKKSLLFMVVPGLLLWVTTVVLCVSGRKEKCYNIEREERNKKLLLPGKGF